MSIPGLLLWLPPPQTLVRVYRLVKWGSNSQRGIYRSSGLQSPVLFSSAPAAPQALKQAQSFLLW